MKSNTKITAIADWWMIFGFSILTALFLAGGFLGIYSMRRALIDIRPLINAVSQARIVQMDFEKQFQLWNTIMLEGDDFQAYRTNLYLFSYRTDRIQDLLFNLKISCSDLDGIPERIEALRDDHGRLTADFSRLTSNLAGTGFADRRKIILHARGRDNALLNSAESLVSEIEVLADARIDGISRYYFLIALVSLILITAVAALTGLYIARKLMRAHHTLDRMVRERTNDLAESNRALEEEIQEHERTEEMLRRAKNDAEEAGRRIALSEEKYRLLVEGTGDLVFSLDAEFRFITVNHALRKIFGFKPEEVVGTGLAELVWDESGGKQVSRDIIAEKLRTMSVSRGPTQFTVALKRRNFMEPRMVHMSLEYLERSEKNEILGKASPITDDSLVAFLVYDKQKYRINNSLTSADDISYRLTRNVVRYLPDSEVTVIRLALREVIINAIEHGNLNITYEEKTEAMARDAYFDFITQRKSDPRYEGRSVELEYAVTAEWLAYKVTDEGDGFDVAAVTGRSQEQANEDGVPHGRGILMTRSVFDEVRFNEKGNQVLLVKHYKKPGAP